MGQRLAGAISPYLRQHADNPVDWWPWGDEPFRLAAERDVPVMVSIGYATCHWCHVMARESFSDPDLAAQLNERFVAIKVDREELPDVDTAYLSAAGAFTRNLGWPLTAFVTPAGRMFFAGTYWPPDAFRQVLDAVTEAWTQRRAEVEESAGRLHEALAQAARRTDAASSGVPESEDLDSAVARLAAAEDREYGGFAQPPAWAPKFPAAPVLTFLLGRPFGRPVAERALTAMAASQLRDDVEGGFFRYATRRDWSEPHWERMLYDNAQLLRLYADAGRDEVAAGIADFLATRLRAGVGFASAQDSESTVAGQRTEGGYYQLDAAARAAETPPALDEKVLAGWNGMAIGALAHAGLRRGRPEWVGLAASVADSLLAAHLRETPDGPRLARVSRAGRLSPAPATLEDYGLLADGLIDVAAATGEARYASAAKRMLDAVLQPDNSFLVPGGVEATLAGQGVAVGADESEGAYPSGHSAATRAAHRLYLLTGERRYLDAARVAVASVAAQALATPLAFGAILDVAGALDDGPQQLVIVTPDDVPGAGVFSAALGRRKPHEFVAVATESQARDFSQAGFELFADRVAQRGATAYACTDFVCRLPTTDPAALPGV